MSDISMREMLEAGVHFGHQTRYWNPQMATYLYGHRNKIHIIDLEQTKVLFQEALNYIGKLSANKGTILFVGTKRAAQQIIREEAERCGMPYVNLRWLGGLLTNYKTVKQSINRLRELEEMKTNGALERLSKKEALHLQRELDKLERNMSGIKDMDGWPDALFIIDVGYEDIAVSEAVKLKIPVVAVVDSNNSPAGVDYVIPGNDDALRSIRLYTKAVADAIIEGKDSVAHLGDGGDKEEFIELDAEGSPIVKEQQEKKEKKEKVQVKKKAARKVANKEEPAKAEPTATDAAEAESDKAESAEAESASAEPAVTDDGIEAGVVAKPETQAQPSDTEASQTDTGQSEVSRDNVICEYVRQVPSGKVAVYSDIEKQVKQAGAKCTARQVGEVMRDLHADSDVPWHRILGKDKKYGVVKQRPGPRGDEEQIRLLEKEGIACLSGGRVNLELYQYDWGETTSAVGTDSKSVSKDTTNTVQD